MQNDLARHCLAHAVSNIHCDVLVTKAIAQHHKLVATDAGDNVGWSRSAHQSLGNGVEQLITNAMTDVVIDIFEFVEIDKQHSDTTLESAAALKCFGEFAQKQHAIWQSCHCIVCCLTSELILQLFCFGDVAGNSRVVRDHSICGAHNLQHDRERAHDAIRASKAKFAFPAIARGRCGDFTWHLVANCLNEHLCCSVVETSLFANANEFSCAIVAKHECAVLIKHQYGICCYVEQANKLLAQYSLNNCICYVMCGADISSDCRVGAKLRLCRYMYPHHFAIWLPQSKLECKRRRCFTRTLPRCFGKLSLGRLRVDPGCGTLSDAATTEGEHTKSIVGTGETTIDIGLKNPNGEGSYRTVNLHIFTGREGQISP